MLINGCLTFTINANLTITLELDIYTVSVFLITTQGWLKSMVYVKILRTPCSKRHVAISSPRNTQPLLAHTYLTVHAF